MVSTGVAIARSVAGFRALARDSIGGYVTNYVTTSPVFAKVYRLAAGSFKKFLTSSLQTTLSILAEILYALTTRNRTIEVLRSKLDP